MNFCNVQVQLSQKRHDTYVGVGQGYTTLSTNIMQFNKLHELPMCIDVGRLDDGSGMEATLMKNKVSGINLATLKFNTIKLIKKHPIDEQF